MDSCYNYNYVLLFLVWNQLKSTEVLCIHGSSTRAILGGMKIIVVDDHKGSGSGDSNSSAKKITTVVIIIVMNSNSNNIAYIF